MEDVSLGIKFNAKKLTRMSQARIVFKEGRIPIIALNLFSAKKIDV